MDAIRLQTVVAKDGEIALTGLPYRKGDTVEMILLGQTTSTSRRLPTARQLRQSSLIGLWKDRTELTDSADFARQLREQAQRRE
jgi:hypothetical protein